MTEKMERIYWKLTINERIQLLREIAFSNMPHDAKDEEIKKIVETVNPSEAAQYNYAALEEMHKRYQWLNYKLASEMLEKAHTKLEHVSERRKKLILQVGCVARMLIQDSNLPAKTRKELMQEWSEDFASFMYSSTAQMEWFQKEKLNDCDFLSARVKRLAELEMKTSSYTDESNEILSRDMIKARLFRTHMLAFEIVLNEFDEYYATAVVLLMAEEKEPKDLSNPKDAIEMLKKGRECLKARFLDNEVCKDTEIKYQQQLNPSQSQAPDTLKLFQARATEYVLKACAKSLEKKGS